VSTHASALAVGHRLDEYLIASLLGHGGFGLTYLAQDTNLNAFVAIKEFLPQEFAVRGANSRVMPRSDSDNDSYRWGLDRFKEEARALARFKHPNIVRAARLLEANGTAYMVMDFEPGMTLSQYLKRHGPVLDEARLLGIFQPVLDGLEALHAQQLVHRDIKPGNIYVRARGGPMLIDFGAVRQAIGAHSRSLTSLVTPGYAPIEQYSSDGRQGAWSDLYAVGATMYYCMFGHAPADAARRSAAISDGSEDPYLTAKSKNGGRYSEELVDAVDWALQFRVRDRPQVAHELRERLRRSQVAPVSVDLPESLAEMPELQNGVISNQGSMPSAAQSLNPMFAMPHSDSLLNSRHDTEQTMPAMAKKPFVGTAKVGPDGEPAVDETLVVNRPSLLARLGALADVYRQRLQAQIEAYRQRRQAPKTEMPTATTITGSPTTLRTLLKPLEPRPVRMGLSALMVILVAAAVITFVRSGSNDQRLFDAAVAANTPAAYQQYLQSCKQCLRRPDALAAVTRFATADRITSLRRQFKELLAHGALAAPADPNAGSVLHELEGLASGDAEVPADRRALTEALKRQKQATPKRVAVQASSKKAVAHAGRPAAKPAHVLAQTKAAASSGHGAAATDASGEPVAQPISQIQPRYPQGARSYGKAGWVEVDFMVNIDGSASDAQVLDAQPKDIFDEAALHAVHIAVFKPYTIDGVRERKRMRLRIDFKP
jgi:TonB family protein